MPIPTPDEKTSVALASIAVHAQEALGSSGHEHDRIAILSLLETPAVKDYLHELDAMSLLPRMR